MAKLQLIKSEKFGEVQADIYRSDNEMYMTANQLCACLGEDRNTFDKRISRNPYLKTSDFSVSDKLTGTDGKMYNQRLFNEDGIYEITMLSESDKAKEFRAWIRKVLKALRKGEAKIIPMTDFQRMSIETKIKNAQVRKARELARLAEKYRNQSFAQILDSYATLELTGEHLIPLPQIQERTYSATEVGKMLGISARRVGVIANEFNLKNNDNGIWCNDKAKHCNKEIPTFRYNQDGIDAVKLKLNAGF